MVSPGESNINPLLRDGSSHHLLMSAYKICKLLQRMGWSIWFGQSVGTGEDGIDLQRALHKKGSDGHSRVDTGGLFSQLEASCG